MDERGTIQGLAGVDPGGQAPLVSYMGLSGAARIPEGTLRGGAQAAGGLVVAGCSPRQQVHDRPRLDGAGAGRRALLGQSPVLIIMGRVVRRRAAGAIGGPSGTGRLRAPQPPDSKQIQRVGFVFAAFSPDRTRSSPAAGAP